MVRVRRSVGERLASGRSIGEVLDEEYSHLRAGPFDEDAFPSRLHAERVAAVLGLALGICFFTCFATGLVSHFAQHPLKIGFLSMPASPGWLYRYNQGLHVITGIAAIPLLLVKLWAVFPKLFAWPPVENLAHAVERASLFPLVGGSIFQLFTGLSNTARWYPWQFDFPAAHYWTAWITIGALIAHIGAKITITRRALSREAANEPEPAGTGINRRGLFVATGTAVAAVTITTAGQTIRPLNKFALLAPRRPDNGPQGFPVNKTAHGARVTELIQDPSYALIVDGRVGRELSFSLAELRALPQHDARHAITCVEGWSSEQDWSGVRVRDLLAMAGADPASEVIVHSLQKRGAYARSELNVPHAQHADTLLALRVGGRQLHPDHGYPARLIAPNRPGVQQTKWIARLEVV